MLQQAQSVIQQSLPDQAAVAQNCMEIEIQEGMETQMIMAEDEVSQNNTAENETQSSEQVVDDLKVTNDDGFNQKNLKTKEVADDGFKQKKLKTSHKTLVAERASSRVAGTGTPIPLRAERRAAWKDSQGINYNSFSVLQNIDNEVLAKVASDCGIVLGKNIEEVDANIDLIKAKEIAQATLFAADKKKGETQNVEEVFTEEETKIEHNEAHARFLQELEVFDPLEEVAEELEMINKGLSVHIPDKPK